MHAHTISALAALCSSWRKRTLSSVAEGLTESTTSTQKVCVQRVRETDVVRSPGIDHGLESGSAGLSHMNAVQTDGAPSVVSSESLCVVQAVCLHLDGHHVVPGNHGQAQDSGFALGECVWKENETTGQTTLTVWYLIKHTCTLM